MWLLFSILTVVLWGTSDVVFKSVSEEKGEAVLLAYNGIILGLASLAYMVIGGFGITWDAIISYLPNAAIYITSMYCYYKAISLVQLSIASPIANSSCVITSLLATFVLGQHIEWFKWIAIAGIVGSIVVISINTGKAEDAEEEQGGKSKKPFWGIVWALAYFVLDGTASFMDDSMLKESISESDVLISYGIWYMLVGIVALCIAIHKKQFSFQPRTLVGSFIETAGQFTYIYAFAFGESVIASPFIASFSVVSVILSRIFLKEKLKPWMYIFIGIMICAMFVLSLE